MGVDGGEWEIKAETRKRGRKEERKPDIGERGMNAET
jgi:hypothetical protein